MGTWGGVFSSKCCCFVVLNTPVSAEGESKGGLEKRVEDREEDVEEEALDELAVIEATAAAALFNCSRDCDNKAKSTVGGRGKEEEVDFSVASPEKVALVPVTSGMSSNLFFLDFWLCPLFNV